MPLTTTPYENEMMFPVFDGLIPEGWLLDIASSSWKIDPRDRMSLLKWKRESNGKAREKDRDISFYST